MQYNSQILVEYFKDYNEQLQQVRGIRTPQLIDDTRGLEGVTESITSQLIKKHQTWEDNYTHQPTAEFCRQVLLYYLRAGEVPDFSVDEIVGGAKNRNAFYIGKAFEEKARELERMGLKR